ncbi:flavoprotein [Fimicolochytrium jonesii]|uniref:flavoprotein n=1 Tax=Fimicolochytrium jonesii TaxID=1396493 RepID=UPI0022FDD579|nr:flavoprotein [Fimicolochytrium jonesii]KAI8821141.1 flavoprotein [Fimicolochytrium jonesii]
MHYLAPIQSDIEIKVISTTHALHFFNRTEVEAEGVPVYTDAEEWAAWTKMSDPVLHIDLRAWADLLLIAPLSANTLSKLASGASDNLLTCVLRAWDTSKPVILCPAMNMHMWTHPFTARHLEVCTSILGYRVIDPVVKKLACGDLGNGAMAEVDTIIGVLGPVIEEVKKVARQGQALATSITTAASLQDVLQSNLGPTGTQKMRGIGSQAPLG